MVAPNALFLDGGLAFEQGVIGSVIKDQTTGDQAFEAGAITLANGGLLCIDAFDHLLSQNGKLCSLSESVFRAALKITEMLFRMWIIRRVVTEHTHELKIQFSLPRLHWKEHIEGRSHSFRI